MYNQEPVFPRLNASHLFLIRTIGTNNYLRKKIKKRTTLFAGAQSPELLAFMFELLLPFRHTRQQI